MIKLRLLSVEKGRCGVLRRFQHPALGVLEIVTVHGLRGAADVIHIQHVAQRVQERKRAGKKRSSGHKPAA
jgi:hypothetical protein